MIFPDWNNANHIGTAPIYSTCPITTAFHSHSYRVGTRYFYQRHWPECQFEKGFRIRPKWRKFLEAKEAEE